MALVFVQLNADTTKVLTVYLEHQSVVADKPGYAEIADDDARFLAWQAAQAAKETYAAALVAGCQLQSTGTPMLDGIYAIEGSSWADMKDEAQYVSTFGAFSAGIAQLAWALPAGAQINFATTAQFLAVVRALGDYLTALKRQRLGLGAAPAQPTIIA